MIRFSHEAAPSFGAATEVADGVLWLRLPLPMALDHVNVFALREPAGWSLVDTGFFGRKTENLWREIQDGPLRGDPVHRVIATHHHPDHIGCAGWFQAQGATLWASRTAWLYARMLTLDAQTSPSDAQIAHWRAAGMAPDLLEAKLKMRPFNFADCVAPLPEGFHRIEDGDTLEIGGRHWLVRFGQGHAPDHATLWCEDEGLVLGGDQFLPSISPNIGVYATEPEADPLGDWLSACTAFKPHARANHLVLPGHKMPYFGLPARLEQLIDNHVRALDRLRDALATPKTATECFKPIFGREIGEAEYGLALVEAVAHLNHLYRRNEVTRTRRADGAWLWHRAS